MAALPSASLHTPSLRGMEADSLFLLDEAVPEGSALIESIAMGAILGDAHRAWIKAEDVGVVWRRLIDLLVRVSIDKGRTLGEFWEMVH